MHSCHRRVARVAISHLALQDALKFASVPAFYDSACSNRQDIDLQSGLQVDCTMGRGRTRRSRRSTHLSSRVALLGDNTVRNVKASTGPHQCTGDTPSRRNTLLNPHGGRWRNKNFTLGAVNLTRSGRIHCKIRCATCCRLKVRVHPLDDYIEPISLGARPTQLRPLPRSRPRPYPCSHRSRPRTSLARRPPLQRQWWGLRGCCRPVRCSCKNRADPSLT